MKAEPYREGLEDGFKYCKEDGTSLGCYPSDLKITEPWHHRIPFIAHGCTELIFITEPSWILTNWSGRKEVVTDFKVKHYYTEFVE